MARTKFLERFGFNSKRKKLENVPKFPQAISEVVRGTRRKVSKFLGDTIKLAGLGALGVVAGVTAAAIAPHILKDKKDVVTPQDTNVKNKITAFQADSKPSVSKYTIEPEQEPVQPYAIDEADSLQESVQKPEAPKMHSFLPGSLAVYKGKYYYVNNSDSDHLDLLDVNTTEDGNTFSIAQSHNSPDLKPAYIEHIVAELPYYVAKDGDNADEIAKAAGNKEGWKKGTLFSFIGEEGRPGRIFTNERDVDKGVRIYGGISNQNMAKVVWEQFQDYLNSFEPGKKYFFIAEGQEPKACEFFARDGQDLLFTTEFNGLIDTLRVYPQDLKSGKIEPISLDQAKYLAQHGELLPEESVAKVEKTEPVVASIKTISPKEGMNIKKKVDYTYEKPTIKKSLAQVIKNNVNIAKKLAHGYFPEIDHTKMISEASKEKMVKWMGKLFERVNKITDGMEKDIHEDLVAKAKEVLGKMALKKLDVNILSETDGRVKESIIPCDNGTAWGPFQITKSYAESGIKNLKKILGPNEVPKFLENFKFKELGKLYKAYQTALARINKSKGLSEKEKEEFRKYAYDQYEDKVYALGSSIMHPASAAHLVLANTIATAERINEIAGDELSAKEKDDFQNLNYLYGNRVFTKNMIPRYIKAKKLDSNLDINLWLQRLGFGKSLNKSLDRKSAAWLCYQEMEQMQGTNQVAQIKEIIEQTHQAEVAKVEAKQNFSKEKKMQKNDENIRTITDHKDDLNLIKSYLAKRDMSKQSQKNFLNLIIAGLVNNPGMTSCADVLEFYIEKYEEEMFLGKDAAEKVECVKMIQKRLVERSKSQSKDYVVAQPTVQEKLYVPGKMLFDKVASIKIKSPIEVALDTGKTIGKVTGSVVEKVANVMNGLIPQNPLEAAGNASKAIGNVTSGIGKKFANVMGGLIPQRAMARI